LENPTKINPGTAQGTLDASQCPLCHQPNDCQLCTVAAYKGSCWCAQVEIPEALLAQVPLDLRNKNCVCRACVTEFHREIIPWLKNFSGLSEMA
jgi:hypothetical protein